MRHTRSSAHPLQSAKHRMPSSPHLPADMNLYAASILIPVGVIMYTAHGGECGSCGALLVQQNTQ